MSTSVVALMSSPVRRAGAALGEFMIAIGGGPRDAHPAAPAQYAQFFAVFVALPKTTRMRRIVGQRGYTRHRVRIELLEDETPR